ncbi:MAG: PilZ domain-containing protein [Deltaproteobacteria bacterium]|nr:PilZ domain-containing protein [Deltaproteobacteria bacterium]MBW2419665.1 PilZ domain-containing protein [Deltaproteobacteria bacterium]
MGVRLSTVDPETDSQGKAFFRSSEERCFDISRGGTFVMTSDPIEPGLRVLLELDIPGGSTVQTLARVVWKTVEAGGSRPAGIGVEFLGGRTGQFGELEKHLARARRWSAARRLDRQATPLLQEIP